METTAEIEGLSPDEIRKRYPIILLWSLSDSYLLPMNAESANVHGVQWAKSFAGLSIADRVSVRSPLKVDAELVLIESWAEIEGFYNPTPGSVMPVWGKPKHNRAWSVMVDRLTEPWTIAGASFYSEVKFKIVKEIPGVK